MPLYALWGYWIPVGTLLLVWGGLTPRRARRVTPLAAFALAVAVMGYWAVGFALHLGGAHAVNPDDPALNGLDRLFAPTGEGWGLAGLAAFFLAGPEVTPTVLALFLAYLPLVAAAVLWAVLALADVRRWVMAVAAAVMGTVVVPLSACWMWGSGWLAHLGETLGLGAGFVDFGGSAPVLWVPAAFALGVLWLQPRREVEPSPALPPAHFPLLANVGALAMGMGWMGWALASPFHTSGVTWEWNRAAVNVWLGMAGAVLTSQLYAWLVSGEVEPLLAARGLAVGWGAVLAGAPFVPPWGAVVVGLLAGLLFPFALYAVEVVVRLRDAAAVVALGLVGGVWGVLSVGLFADGRWGGGWNRMAVEGVRGLVGGGGWAQLQAQVVGLVALGLWGLLWGLGVGLVARPWGGRPGAEVQVVEGEAEAQGDVSAEAGEVEAAEEVQEAVCA